jgi:hypothetical protein
LTPHQHLRALKDELAKATKLASGTTKGKQLLKFLVKKIDNLLHPKPPNKEQRMVNETQIATCEEEQRVIDTTPIITISQITKLPTIMKTNNHTAKRVLKGTKHLHRQVT